MIDDLDSYRAHLDALDEEIVRLLGERFDVCREIARHKSKYDLPMMQPQRVRLVRARYAERGAIAGLPPDFVSELFELLIDATCKMEDELIAQSNGVAFVPADRDEEGPGRSDGVPEGGPERP